MRKINTREFQLATRTTRRVINQQIVLNLIREHQPISRADLARRLQVSRAMVSSLVDGLITEGAVFEGGEAHTARGRRPTRLYVRTADRTVIAVDVRFPRTTVMLSNFDGQQIALEELDTPRSSAELVHGLALRIAALRKHFGALENCEGIGLIVPGVVQQRTGLVLESAHLGWRDLALARELERATGLRVVLESESVAPALAYLWMNPARRTGADNFVYVRVSDTVSVSVVANGEVLRGFGHATGEVGHIPLNPRGPQCICGLRGCWEVYVSSFATVARYLGLEPGDPRGRAEILAGTIGVEELAARAQTGDAAARAALRATGRFMGFGIAAIITALNPERVVIDGEITAAWPLIHRVVRSAVRRRVLNHAAAIPIIPAPAAELPRLRGATALLVAQNFAAPKVA